MIYFDSTATTKPTKEILELYNKISLEYWYNSSSAYTMGIKSNNLLQKSIEVLKEVLKLKDHNVITLHTPSKYVELTRLRLPKEWCKQQKSLAL